MSAPGPVEPSKPGKRRWWIIGSTLILVALGAGWWNMRWPSYDESRVHPKLRGLVQPLRAFRVGYYTDGGTIGMSGEDQTGREFKVILPNQMGKEQGYNLIVVGCGFNEAFSGEFPQERLDQDTRRMLARFIRDYEKLDPDYWDMRNSGMMPWQWRWDCPLGQELLKNRFPLCLPN